MSICCNTGSNIDGTTNMDIGYKTQNIDSKTTSSGTTNFLGSLNVNGAPVASSGSLANYVLKAGDTMSGPLVVNNTTASSSTSTGSFTTTGGISAAKKIYIGSDSNILGSEFIGPTQTVAVTKRVNIYGANPGGSHVVMCNDADQYPIMELMPYSHGNNGIFFDAYFTDPNWRSSSTGSNLGIYKQSNELRFYYNSGVAVGTNITWNTAGSINLVNGGLTWQKPITTSDTTDSSSISTGSMITGGGLGVAKNVYIGGSLNAVGNVGLVAANSFGGGTGVISINNRSVVPTTNNASGGILFVEAGALKFRGSAGTVTTIAPA